MIWKLFDPKIIICYDLIVLSINKKQTEERAKVTVWGTNCPWKPHYSHLAARLIGRKVSGRTIHFGGWWFGVVWTRWSFIFLKHQFCQGSVLLLILFLKSSWCLICEFRPPSSSDDLCLLFCLFLLLLCMTCIGGVLRDDQLWWAARPVCPASDRLHPQHTPVRRIRRLPGTEANRFYLGIFVQHRGFESRHPANFVHQVKKPRTEKPPWPWDKKSLKNS